MVSDCSTTGAGSTTCRATNPVCPSRASEQATLNASSEYSRKSAPTRSLRTSAMALVLVSARAGRQYGIPNGLFVEARVLAAAQPIRSAVQTLLLAVAEGTIDQWRQADARNFGAQTNQR